MFCPRCGAESLPDHKFCKSCGAALSAAGGAQSVAAGVAAAAVPAQAPPPLPPPPGVMAPPMGAMPPQGPPPGMVAVMYQAYPGGPQQAVYMPASQVHPHAHEGVLGGLRARIRKLASTDQLEGFSLGQMFSEVFKRRGHDELEDYFMVGSARTTPPLELVETGWPKPWMFFRVLATIVIAYVIMAVMFHFTTNTNLVPALLLLGSFATPLATLTLFFELNSPRNVSMYMVGKLFITGAVVSLCAALVLYMLPVFNLLTMEAGIVEEVAKLFAVIVVVRSVRFKYQLNGILFGATVGAGFSAFETMGYGLQSFLPAFIQGLQTAGTAQAGQDQALSAATAAMMSELFLRMFTAAPLGHMVWTAISAGAFWRVKQDRPFSAGMLTDKHFLMAFAIPIVMHAIWDAPIQLPFLGNEIITGLISWYVLFMLVQQGLQQVKQEQMSHLQSALANVEATLGLGTMRQPQGAVPVA
jgi:RsiW-degrading membrane proteinase PrsW (M82 family)